MGACGAKSPQSKAPVDTAAIIGAIKADEVHWNSDYKRGDAGVLAGHYAPTATLMIPGAAPMIGTAAIKAGLERRAVGQGLHPDVRQRQGRRVGVGRSGRRARKPIRRPSTDPKTKAVATEKGSYVTVYKPQPDGGVEGDLGYQYARRASAPRSGSSIVSQVSPFAVGLSRASTGKHRRPYRDLNYIAPGKIAGCQVAVARRGELTYFQLVRRDGSRKASADGRRRHIPHLFDDQADHLGCVDDAV